jgi:predicted lipoprotein with Yx(FWY)xxD motif
VGNGAVGAFLTGDDGKTLYIFKRDSGGSSACDADCATNWPPLVVADGKVPAAGDGVTGALTTFARADGSMQVAYKGAPLYYYAGDSAAGDTNGEGVGDVWFVAAP